MRRRPVAPVLGSNTACIRDWKARCMAGTRSSGESEDGLVSAVASDEDTPLSANGGGFIVSWTLLSTGHLRSALACGPEQTRCRQSRLSNGST